MASDDHRLVGEPSENSHGAADLLDDVAKPDFWTKIVAGDRDAHLMRIQAARLMRMEALVQRLPIAAVNVHHARSAAGLEQIQRGSLAFPIADFASGFDFAIGGG